MDPTDQAPDDEVLDTAIAWAVRMRSGMATDADARALAEWRAADPAHERAWQQLAAVDGVFEPAARGGGRAARHALEQARRRRRRRLGGAGLVVAAVAVVLAVLAEPGPWQRLRADHYTGAGERGVVELAGGGRMQLDSASAVTVERSGATRTVELLQGAVAIRTGASGDARRTRVRAGGFLFEPVGTRFFVRRAGDATQLHVEAGRVRVSRPGDAAGVRRVAAAGDTLRITGERVRRIARPAIEPGGWTQGVVVARDARLREVVERLDRYHRGWLGADTDAGALRVSGVFQLDDTDTALASLADALPVRIERRTPLWTRVTRR